MWCLGTAIGFFVQYLTDQVTDVYIPKTK